MNSPWFHRLKYASFTHSVVYTGLLTVWLVPGLHSAEFVLGMTHGLGWIAMSFASLAAVRARIVTLRLAVAITILGGIAPFFGSWEFLRAGRPRTASTTPARG
jgi:type IV secretory pathway VirB6-like protein